MDRTLRARVAIGVFAAVSSIAVLFSFPTVLTIQVEHAQERTFAKMREQFPVTVNPHKKLVVEDPEVNAFLESPHAPLSAALGVVDGVFEEIFAWIAIAVGNSPWYQALAASDGRFVRITAGMRKEQIANAFAGVLGWSAAEKKAFLTRSPYSPLPLSEGSYSPGVYIVAANATPLEAQALINDRFSTEVLSHYGTTTAALVPLEEALTIASLIEREAAGADDRRLISGVIWNRLFINMNLQIDATVQYAKANAIGGSAWWPAVLPRDISRASPYNTYAHPGLPPTPIANPSLASILAALNPRETSCLFYFHDTRGGFHCSDTYAEHVALLKKFYGRGK